MHCAKSWLKQDSSEHDRLNQPQQLVSIMIRPNTFKMVDAKMRRLPKISKIEAIMRANVLLKYGPIKKYNGSYWRWVKKQNIWENIAAKLNDNGYKRYKLLSLSKTEYLGTEESANAVSSLNYVCTPHLDIYAINMKLPIFIQPCMKRV